MFVILFTNLTILADLAILKNLVILVNMVIFVIMVMLVNHVILLNLVFPGDFGDLLLTNYVIPVNLGSFYLIL